MDKTQKKAAPKNCSCGFKIAGRVKDLGTSASHALRQSQDEPGANLRELYEQNLELEKKIRAERKRGVELQREVEKCPVKGWWEEPIEQLTLEELKLHQRRFKELSKMLIQSIGDQAIDSHNNNSDDPSRIDS
ncbi:hypothetical protein ACJRO7_031580 [Eucalyptus globulus]|uniref:Uncharacterized protein n=1 Tax=Eucalyptus globulus TaxID=34317 RepID=A0ABD3JQW6_EUCGL